MALAQIERSLGALGRVGVLRLLRPGIPMSKVVQVLDARGLAPPADLQRLYQWHNGTDATTGTALDDLHLFPGFYLLSLEDAVANYDAFVRSERWDREWVPVFANGGGDFYAVVCSAELEGHGSVVHFRIEESRHPIEYRSLTSMLTTIATAYEEGIYFVDNDGYLEMDDEAFLALAARLNGDVSWWHE